MKAISDALQTHLNGEELTLATCWKLTRTDGVVIACTDHDRDLTVGGVTYKAATGYSRSAIATTAKLSVDNLTLEGLLDSEDITAEDLRAGKYDYAAIEIFLVNWAALASGRLQLRRGWLGDVTLRRGQFVAELRGLTQALTRNIVELFSADCRADLGDSRCTVDLAPLTVSGTVTAAGGKRNFGDTARTEPAYYFTHGLVTWLTGANAGKRSEVKSYDPGEFFLFLPLPYAIQVGDTYQAYPGCDKRLETCREKFHNVLNFRGEPWVVGQDEALATPDVHL